MPSINNSYHAHSGNYNAGGNRCAYIVIHNTGNTASANAEARYASNNQHNSSYHYVLDDYDIYQILDDYDRAWAVGAWSGARQLIGNNESISIEVCSNGTYFTESEIENLTWLVGVLMERHNIPAENVVRHYDCHTGHKDCPAAYVNSGAWNELWSTITNGAEMVTDEDIAKIRKAVSEGVWEFVYHKDQADEDKTLGDGDKWSNSYNVLREIYWNTYPGKQWEFVYHKDQPDEDKILGDGPLWSTRYNVINATYEKVCELEKRLDELEK